jgi:DNA polymerase II
MKSYLGFVVHPTYKTSGGVSTVHLFGRLESGESFETRNVFRPYFCIKKSDLKKALEIQKFDHEDAGWKNFQEEPVVKVVLNTPSQVKPLRDSFQKSGIICYEADIRFEYRFMFDNFIQSCVEIIGESKKGEYTDLLFIEPKFKGCDHFPKNLKILSTDIETSMTGKKVYSISIVCGDVKKVLIVSKNKLKYAESFKSEEEMLKRFKDLVCELDPDIITGWNLIDFDLKILHAKFKEHNIPFTIGRGPEAASIRVFESFFQDSKCEIMGRVAIDGIQLLKWNFIALEDYKLDTASQHFLGEAKLIGHEDKGKQIEDAYKNNQQLLVDYNLKDSEMVLGILEKSTALQLSIQRSLLTGMPLDRIKASIASLDSVYLKELRKRGYVAPTTTFEDDETDAKGGYVMNSKPGIYDYIVVCDFRSLYPSIMRTFNIDPLSFVADGKGKNLIKVPSGATFKRTEGIMPDLIERLLKQRDVARKKKDEYAKHAIKILMNSFYGVLGNQNCRFYSLEMTNGITLTGQHILKLVTKKVEEMGYEVIYGDTDSIFIHPKVDSMEAANKVGNKIVSTINAFLDEYTMKEFERHNKMELQFERVFVRFIMPKVRGSDVGSKKRYAGLVIDENGKESIKFTGMEFVRRDWTDLAKNFQKELLDRIFHKKEVTEYVRKMVEDVRSGKLDKQLVYRKAIRKDMEAYTKTTPPHVKAARLIKGELTSNIIEYYITVEGPEPIQNLRHKIDYDHYIEKQMRPIADSVLDFFGTTFDDILKGSRQKTLFGF